MDTRGLVEAFDRTPGMTATIRDGVLTVQMGFAALGGRWSMCWHNEQEDMAWTHGVDRTGPDRFVAWDPEQVRPVSLAEALGLLNAPFERGDTGREFDSEDTDPETLGMLDLALALDDIVRRNAWRQASHTLRPPPKIAVPFRLVWDA